MKAGCTYFGYSPAETMSIAQRLYHDDLISYPRTETSAYHQTFQAEKLLRDLKSIAGYENVSVFFIPHFCEIYDEFKAVYFSDSLTFLLQMKVIIG